MSEQIDEERDAGGGWRDDVATLRRDGVVGRKGAFPRAFVEGLRDELLGAFFDAIQRPRGAVSRGPRRWYVEIHPETISGFAAIAGNPWVTAIAAAVLGPDYEIVEVGFDVPFEGARDQPWHRDFPSPPESWAERRITSLAFNVTAIDVAPDMGPFEVAPGTQWEDGRDWPHGMFPPPTDAGRYEAGAVRKFPVMGDISCRSALTIHRGTAHRSPTPRPVLVLGVDAPGAGHAALHDMAVTRSFRDGLPPVVRDHLNARVVDRLPAIVQKHDIEGLVMGAS